MATSLLQPLILQLVVPQLGPEAPMLAGIDTAGYRAALKKARSVVLGLAYTNGASVDVDV